MGIGQFLHPVENIRIQMRKYATVMRLQQWFLLILGTVFPRFVLLTLYGPKEVSLPKQNPKVLPTTVQKFVKFQLQDIKKKSSIKNPVLYYFTPTGAGRLCIALRSFIVVLEAPVILGMVESNP